MKAGQNTQLAHLSVYTHQQWPTLCMSTFASPIVWVRMSKSDCIVYLLNMHFSLSGCSIEGRTPSTSASVCGGSACMKPRAHMGRWQCGFYHAREYCSIPLWCTALRCLWTFLMKASGNSQSCLGTARIRDGQRGNLGLQNLLFLLKLFRRTDLGGCLAVDPFGFISFPWLLHSVSAFMGSRRLYKLSLSRQASDIIAALMQVLQWLLSQVPGQAMLGIQFKMFLQWKNSFVPELFALLKLSSQATGPHSDLWNLQLVQMLWHLCTTSKGQKKRFWLQLFAHLGKSYMYQHV